MSTVRKSSRLQTKDTNVTYAEPGSDDESREGSVAGIPSDDDPEEEPKPGRSKRKRPPMSPSKDKPPRKRLRGKRGLLERMTELPMDLLFEIFGKLDPLDVLHLSRTTKALRAILLSRSSIAIWKECLGNSGLPPCPDDMNEPQWADLAFGKHCQVCLRAVPQHVVWDARVRACSRCVEATLFSHLEIDRHNLPQRLVRCLPSFDYQTTGRRRRHVRGYHLPTIRKWIAEYAEVPANDGDAWIDAKILESDARSEHTALCIEWHDERLMAKEEKANADRDARIALIIAKLEDAGYSDSVEQWRKTSFWGEPPLRELLKKEITERVWMGAKDAVLARAGRYHQTRIEREHQATIKTRHELFVQIHSDYSKTQPIDTPIIPVADLFQTPEVKDAFKLVPLDRDMAVEDFNEVFNKIPFFTERWLAETKNKLLDMAKPHLTLAFTPAPLPEAALDLAVAARCFQCSCHSTDWKLALAHPHKSFAPGSLDSDADARLFGSNTGQYTWNSNNHIEFNPTYFDRAKGVLHALGYDYKTITAQDLDELDEIIECTSCTSYDRGRHMLDWRAAIIHMYGTTHTYVKVDAETASKVRARMREAAIKSRYSTYSDPFICTHCRFVGNGSGMRAHLAQKHDITSATNADVALLPHANTLLRSLQYWDFGTDIF